LQVPSIRVAGYELFERLGEGGAGQVYRATDVTGRALAVKLLGRGADLEPDAAHARFAREVKILAQLDHPMLATLVAYGVDDELGPFLVMPLVPGKTLRELVKGANLCPEAALLLLEPVAAAVAALHERDIVHRDLKPENVMIAPDGRVVVVDLGLAWGPAHSRHTQEGTAIGSVPYMAPEQIEGSGVGTASDVWGLGVMLYELVSGRRPFARPRASEESAAALVGSYTPLEAAAPRCPPEIARLVVQSLDRAPGARPSAQAFAEELAAAIDWCDRGEWPQERAKVAHGPTEYTQRIAPFRIRREKRLAREAIEAGRPFEAIAHIDRALGYVPDDRELLALADEAERKSSESAERSGPGAGPLGSMTRGRSEPPVRSTAAAKPVEPTRPVLQHRRVFPLVAAAAVVSAAAVLGGIWFATQHSSTRSFRDAPPEQATDGAAAMIAPTPALTPPPAPAPAPAPKAPKQPITGLVPLEPAGIPNDLPNHVEDMKAPPGEHLVAQSRLQAATPEQAVADIDAEVKKNPDRLNRLGQAMVYIGAGRDDGLAKLDQVVADFPDFGKAWSAKAYIEARAGHSREAEAALNKAIAIDPDDAEALRNRGILRDHEGRARDAYPDLVASLRREPNDVEALSELAQIYSQANHRDDARPLLERIVHYRPDDPTGWLDLSLVQAPADAVESIRRALALAPKLPRAHVRLCTVQTELGVKDALVSCDEAVQLAPDDAWSWMGRGLARYQLADDKKGLADVDHAIAMKPDDASFYVNRYILRTHAGMLDEAKDDLKHACKLGKQEACDKLR
jgi:tetratricopeptide (TPR) repeat protein